MPPYFARLSPKLVEKKFLAKQAACNVVRAIGDEEGSFLAFVDKNQVGVVELAREIVRAWHKPEDSGESPELLVPQDEYYKLRVLFDDLDLERENPSLQEQLDAINCKSTFSQFQSLSKHCFVEAQIEASP